MRVSIVVWTMFGLIACAPAMATRAPCVPCVARGPCTVAPSVDAATRPVDPAANAVDAAADARNGDASDRDVVVAEDPRTPSLRAQVARWVDGASRLSERSLSLVRAGSARAVSWERGLYMIECVVRDDASRIERAYRVYASTLNEHVIASVSWTDRMEFQRQFANDFVLAAMQSWLDSHDDLRAVIANDPRAHPRMLMYRTANTSTVCVGSTGAHAFPFATCWAEPGIVEGFGDRSFTFARNSDGVGSVYYDARMPDGRAQRVRVSFSEEGRARMARGRAAAAAIPAIAYPETGPLALLSARTQQITASGPLAIEWSSNTQWLRCERIDRWRCQSTPRAL